MKQIERINEIMDKEKSPFRRLQMMKVLRDLENEWRGKGEQTL